MSVFLFVFETFLCIPLATSTTMCTWCGCEDMSQDLEIFAQECDSTAQVLYLSRGMDLKVHDLRSGKKEAGYLRDLSKVNVQEIFQ